MTVRYINESAVNISWSQITEVNDNEIEGYTVYYSPITATNQKSRSIKNVTFNGNGNSTNHGVIVGLSTSETGYQFLVVVRTSESGSVQETCALDLRTVIAVHNRSGEQDKTTEGTYNHYIEICILYVRYSLHSTCRQSPNGYNASGCNSICCCLCHWYIHTLYYCGGHYSLLL